MVDKSTEDSKKTKFRYRMDVNNTSLPNESEYFVQNILDIINVSFDYEETIRCEIVIKDGEKYPVMYVENTAKNVSDNLRQLTVTKPLFKIGGTCYFIERDKRHIYQLTLLSNTEIIVNGKIYV